MLTAQLQQWNIKHTHAKLGPYPVRNILYFCGGRLKSGADPNAMDETGAKPGDIFHDGVTMSQRFEIKKLLRQRYNLMGERCVVDCSQARGAQR